MASKMFDFSSKDDGDQLQATAVSGSVCTYEVFDSDAKEATPVHPILVLADPDGTLTHHISGSFLSPDKRTAFQYSALGGTMTADFALIDRRFGSLLSWIGYNQFDVRLSGQQTDKGYAVYKIREVDSGGETKLSAEDGFLQYVIGRLLDSETQDAAVPDEQAEEDDDEMKITSMQSITDFMQCASNTLPANIRSWAKRNLAVARSKDISPEEKRHALRALSIMLNIKWKNDYFESIDPVEARRILDEELYGMEKVKQRIIETIIQINRTHTLPAYGLLLCGPAGTGKSQVAYAVARILRLPWTSLDMSAIHDSEQLTGSSRVYSNAKPGSIMEAFYMAGESNLVFIINELDKAEASNASGNPADALLTLLDNLGYTDNYMECTIPTSGVYPIATANDKARISAPLMSRFAVIDIPDYTREEKKTIFLRFSLPKVLARLGMKKEECVVTDEAVEVILDTCKDVTGVRDLEQAAEHLAANALYRIETEHVETVTFDRALAEKVLEA